MNGGIFMASLETVLPYAFLQFVFGAVGIYDETAVRAHRFNAVLRQPFASAVRAFSDFLGGRFSPPLLGEPFAFPQYFTII